jgi:hypothetical protein
VIAVNQATGFFNRLSGPRQVLPIPPRPFEILYDLRQTGATQPKSAKIGLTHYQELDRHLVRFDILSVPSG